MTPIGKDIQPPETQCQTKGLCQIKNRWPRKVHVVNFFIKKFKNFKSLCWPKKRTLAKSTKKECHAQSPTYKKFSPKLSKITQILCTSPKKNGENKNCEFDLTCGPIQNAR